VQALRDLLARNDERVTLDVIALEIATIEYPDLDPSPFLAILDSYAVELAARLHDEMTGADFLDAMNAYLFEELGFAGNRGNYYDVRNSCLNEVLARRTGIPITLAVIYMEVARRLVKPVVGIGYPGHFVACYDDGDFSAYIDVFHGGRQVTFDGCDPSVLAPVDNRQIAIRMLNNLREIYVKGCAWKKLARLLDLLLIANPDSAETRAQRETVRKVMSEWN
jgi:regulator of sirC expression with transglutaminase-like and TPR domain